MNTDLFKFNHSQQNTEGSLKIEDKKKKPRKFFRNQFYKLHFLGHSAKKPPIFDLWPY